MFYLVLITSNDWLNPQYSYPLSDEMIVGHTFAKPSLVKCQIINICKPAKGICFYEQMPFF